MKMRSVRFIGIILALSGASSARAAFDSAFVSPQAAAMASSRLAATNDSAGIFINPAAISSLRGVDLYFMHNRLFAGLEGVGTLTEGFFTAGVPTKIGNFGVGYGSFKASGLLQESTFALSFARNVWRGVQAGITTKRLSREHLVGEDAAAAQDPVFAGGTSRAGWAFDLGVSAMIRPPLTAAFAVRNINQPNLGLASEDRVAREFEGGVALEFAGIGLMATSNLAFRESGFGTARDRLLFSLGLEKALFQDRFAVRLGANPLELGAGFGLMLNRFGVDYAMTLKRNLLEPNAASHRIGFRLRFGGPSQTSYSRDPLDDEPLSGSSL